jgi:hypothetical protein
MTEEGNLYDTLERYNLLYNCNLRDAEKVAIRNQFPNIPDSQYNQFVQEFYLSAAFNPEKFRKEHESGKFKFRKHLQKWLENETSFTQEKFESMVGLAESDTYPIAATIAKSLLKEILREYEFRFDKETDNWNKKGASILPKIPSCKLRSSKQEIEAGQEVLISWETTHATEFIIEGLGTMQPSHTGNIAVQPAETTTYKGIVKGLHGEAMSSVTVVVLPSRIILPGAAVIPQIQEETPPPKCSFFASKTRIEEGEEITLFWETQNAESFYIDNERQSVASKGSKIVKPKNSAKYVAVAEGAGAKVEETVSIMVTQRKVVVKESDAGPIKPKPLQNSRSLKKYAWLVAFFIAAVAGYYLITLLLAPKYPPLYVFAESVSLRVAPTTKSERIGTLEYGTKVFPVKESPVFDIEEEAQWYPVKANGSKGYVHNDLLLSERDFQLLEGVLSEPGVKALVQKTSYRRAVIDYMNSRGLDYTLWKIVPNTDRGTATSVYLGKVLDRRSKIVDFAILLDNVETGERKFLLFSFDSDEKPFLVEEQVAPSRGFISSVSKRGSAFVVNYSVVDRVSRDRSSVIKVQQGNQAIESSATAESKPLERRVETVAREESRPVPTKQNEPKQTVSNDNVAERPVAEEVIEAPVIGRNVPAKATAISPSSVQQTILKVYRGALGSSNITMSLEYSSENKSCAGEGRMTRGTFYYNAQGSLKKRNLNGSTCENKISLKETNGYGEVVGTFEGAIGSDGVLRGKYKTGNEEVFFILN